LFVDLIWRNLLYIPVERGDLIQSLPRTSSYISSGILIYPELP
jgi:hypothetical protein